MIETFVSELQDVAKVEQMPKMEGRKMLVILMPK